MTISNQSYVVKWVKVTEQIKSNVLSENLRMLFLHPGRTLVLLQRPKTRNASRTYRSMGNKYSKNHKFKENK